MGGIASGTREETGVPARYEESGAKSDEEAISLVVSLNEHRRHLERLRAVCSPQRDWLNWRTEATSISQKIMGLSERKTHFKNRHNARKSRQTHGRFFGSATRARTVLRHGTKEDEQEVLSGKVSLTKKEEQVRGRNSVIRRLPPPAKTTRK